MPEYRDSQGNVIPKAQQPSPADRVGRATTPMSTPVACEKCGSSYFYTIHAEQFAGGGYGSMEFRSITASPLQLRICICGWPKPPEASAAGGARSVLTARDEFYRSVKAAKEYLDKQAVSGLMDKIANATASKAELEALKAELEVRLTALQTTIAGVASAKSHVPATPAKPHRAPAKQAKPNEGSST